MDEFEAEFDEHVAPDDRPTTSMARAVVLYSTYIVTTAGLWVGVAAVPHGAMHWIFVSLAVVFSALAVWSVAVVAMVAARAVRDVNARRRGLDDE